MPIAAFAQRAAVAEPEDFSAFCEVPGKWLNPPAVARVLGRSLQHVYDMLKEGALEAMGPPNRAVTRYVISKRSVLRHIAECSNFDPTAYPSWASAFIETLTTEQRARLVGAAGEKR